MKVCEICGPDSVSRISVLYETESFNVLRCSQCGLVYVDETPRSSKGVGIPLAYEEVRRGLDRCLEQVAAQRLKYVQSLTRKKSGRLLDIGCGTGEFLKVATAQGWNATGLDLDKAAVDIATRDHKVNAIWSTLEEADLPKGHFDVITLLGVIEHVPHPLPFLKRVRDLLQPEGYAILETPLEGTVLTRIAHFLYVLTRGRLRFHIRYFYSSSAHGGHIYRFSKETLTILMEKAGLAVRTYRLAPTSVRFLIRQRNVGKSLKTKLYHYLLLGVGFSALKLVFGPNHLLVSATKQDIDA